MAPQRIYQALIVGSGYGGLGQGAELVRNGVDDFLVLEKADDLGGVWRDNTYPGAACDTQSVIYCFSYFLNLRVTRMFAGQDELLAYLRNFADEFDLTRRIRFGARVTEAVWDESSLVWRIRTAQGEEFLTRAFIPAWGQLSVPAVPDFPDAEAFEGVAFHSSRWRHDIDFAGKRVASIGAAATAVQYVPEIAREAAHLTVFQRSANYILPRDQYVFSNEETAGFVNDPARFGDLRREIHQFRESGFERTRRGTTAAEEGQELARRHLEAQVSDPALRANLTPDYDYGCKRILRSDDFYPALVRDNVDLVVDRIARFTPEGIATVDGAERPFDVVVYATGFKSQAFQSEMRVVGVGGLTLDERWGDAPEAYLGISVDGFPNMFLVYGPNTNLNHNSVVTMLEIQHRYITECVRHLVENPTHVLDVAPEVLRKFNDKVQADLEQSAFSSDCSSWYKNADGRVINNWSGTVEEYRQVAHDLRLEDYMVGAALTS